ncbi:MAG: hypothetical protein EU549_01075 [Promethearchaeota archaeon]|nr:MAG: hypothetical protein EU549_01075 [Candidatus Lokiarchaeota archaeon]
MNLVEEFWIINFDGIPYFSFAPDEELDSNLLGSFFSAIQSFAKQISSDSRNDKFIHSITLGKYLFFFLVNPKNRLYFISKSKKNISEKNINQHLKKIERMFIEDYKEKIENFDGEIDAFEHFREKFKKYFEDNFTKLKGMW